MRSALVLVAGAACAAAIAVPAAVGLSGNPSFSEGIPVRTPSSAHLVTFDNAGQAVERESSEPRSATPTAAATSRGRESESGDDRGGGTSGGTSGGNGGGDDH